MYFLFKQLKSLQEHHERNVTAREVKDLSNSNLQRHIILQNFTILRYQKYAKQDAIIKPWRFLLAVQLIHQLKLHLVAHSIDIRVFKY